MARQCDITGVKVTTGNNVSHSMRHTRRTFLPNLQVRSFFSHILGEKVTLRLTAKALRTISKYGDIDAFMIQWKNRKTETFSPNAKKVRHRIMKKATVAA